MDRAIIVGAFLFQASAEGADGFFARAPGLFAPGKGSECEWMIDGGTGLGRTDS